MMTGKQFIKVYKKHGSIKAIARAFDISYRQVRKAYIAAVKEGYCDPISVGRKPRENIKKPEPKFSGKVGIRRELTFEIPESGIARYIFTSAQNNTVLHDAVWQNLLALADHYGAKLYVGRFSYVKSGLGARGDKAKFVKRHEAIGHVEDLWWDDRLKDHILDERTHLAPGLMWCGEVNILPTAERPLSGFENYTARQSGIYPHPKVAMDSVPSGKYEPTKFNYTTGAVTLRNYIQRKAGLKAEFHHCFHPDVEFLTDRGLKSFRDTLGSVVKVWSGHSWEDGEIRSFGIQKFNRVTFVPAVLQNCNGTSVYRAQNSKLKREVRVTGDHTWHLVGGEVTRDISIGDVVHTSTVELVREGDEFEEGVRHGLIFGDGSVCYKSGKTDLYSHQLCMHGEQVGKWSHLFDKITYWQSRSVIGNYIGTAYYKSKTNMKELPPDESSPEYVCGFLTGWIAADGHNNRRDNCIQLCSVTKYALEWASSMAPYAGLVATGICRGSGDFTTFGKLREPCWRLTLTDKPRFWKVSEIEPDGEGEVMCAVVEPSHTFTLSGGILTGNCYSGLLVEVDSDGDWFVRQLNADQDGDIHDLDLKVSGGKVTTGHGLEAICWGDIHCHELDPSAAELAWGKGGILDTLKPKYQFFHDVLDFRSRSHHEVKDPHKMFVKHVLGHEDVRGEVDQVARFLKATLRPWCQSVVVDSNHHNHLGRWLRDEDGRKDPVNAEFWLQVQSAVYGALRECGSVNYLKEGLAAVGFDLGSVRFLEEDESFVICQDRGGIETGIHGHNGPNGSRGSALKFAKMGRRANIGHCLTADHDVLTRDRGWLSIAEAGESEQILGYHSGACLWTPVLERHEFLYTGHIIDLDRRGIVRQEVTSQHYLYLRDGSYIPITEALLTKSLADLPVNAPYGGPIGDLTIDERRLRQIVAVCADGNIERERYIRFNVKKKRKIARLQYLFGNDLNQPGKENAHNGSVKQTLRCDSVSHSAILFWLNDGSHLVPKAKQLPPCFRQLSSDCRRILLDELQHWDGTFKGTARKSSQQFSTAKESEALLVAELALLEGFRTSCYKRPDSSGWIVSWHEDTSLVYGSNNPHLKSRLNSWGSVRTRHVESLPTYCFTTGTRNFWVRHRKTGNISLTGNSHRAAILDGVYVAGVCCGLNPSWTKGPGAWSHSHIVVYPNGKRAIITCWQGKWAAGRGISDG